MRIEVWSLPGCSRCHAAKTLIASAGHDVVDGDLKAVQRGDVRDVDVLTQLTLQNGYAPVLRAADGKPDAFIEPEFLGDWLEAHKEGP